MLHWKLAVSTVPVSDPLPGGYHERIQNATRPWGQAFPDLPDWRGRGRGGRITSAQWRFVLRIISLAAEFVNRSPWGPRRTRLLNALCPGREFRRSRRPNRGFGSYTKTNTSRTESPHPADPATPNPCAAAHYKAKPRWLSPPGLALTTGTFGVRAGGFWLPERNGLRTVLCFSRSAVLLLVHSYDDSCGNRWLALALA